MSDHTLIALSREVAALTQERDRLQQELTLTRESLLHADRKVQALDAAASHLHPVADLLVRVSQCCDLGCPDIDLEQDGDLDLSWFKPDATISASLSVKGRVAWAAHLPALKSHGQFHLPELADDFKIALTAYAQLPDAPAAAAWQDIATAPIPGIPVLVWVPRRGEVFGALHDDDANIWRYLSPTAPEMAEVPTHWRPLPAPPAASRREEEPTT